MFLIWKFVSSTKNVRPKQILGNGFNSFCVWKPNPIVPIFLTQAYTLRGFCCSGSVTLLKKGESKQKLWIFLGFQDRDTQNFHKLVLYFPKVHSWLTYGLKSGRFCWYFTTFHENEERVLLKICLNKLKHCWVKKFVWPKILLSCW